MSIELYPQAQTAIDLYTFYVHIFKCDYLNMSFMRDSSDISILFEDFSKLERVYNLGCIVGKGYCISFPKPPNDYNYNNLYCHYLQTHVSVNEEHQKNYFNYSYKVWELIEKAKEMNKLVDISSVGVRMVHSIVSEFYD